MCRDQAFGGVEDFDHMRAITCNHGLNGDGSGVFTSGTVSHSVFRTGRPSDRSDRLSTIDPFTSDLTIGLCSFTSSPISANVPWSTDTSVQDPWAHDDEDWAPGFNPLYDNGY